MGILTRFEIWDQKSWQKNKELGFKKFQKVGIILMKYNHFSVLEEEVLSYVDDTKPSIVLDATLGFGRSYTIYIK